MNWLPSPIFKLMAKFFVDQYGLEAISKVLPTLPKEAREGLRLDSDRTNTPEQLRELMAMGISPNAVVRMIDNYARHVIFNVDHKKFAADKEITSGIAVQILW